MDDTKLWIFLTGMHEKLFFCILLLIGDRTLLSLCFHLGVMQNILVQRLPCKSEVMHRSSFRRSVSICMPLYQLYIFFLLLYFLIRCIIVDSSVVCHLNYMPQDYFVIIYVIWISVHSFRSKLFLVFGTN